MPRNTDVLVWGHALEMRLSTRPNIQKYAQLFIFSWLNLLKNNIVPMFEYACVERKAGLPLPLLFSSNMFLTIFFSHPLCHELIVHPSKTSVKRGPFRGRTATCFSFVTMSGHEALEVVKVFQLFLLCSFSYRKHPSLFLLWQVWET